MKKFYAFILFLIGLIIVITWNRKQAADEIIKSVRVVDNSIIPTDSNVLYFPLDSPISTSLDRLNKLNNEWYSKMLFALHEPVIFQSNDSTEVFRFLWLRTFHNPISIRINNYNSKHILTLKISGGTGGFDAGKVIVDTSFYISKKEWDIFKSKVTKINFWNLSPTEILDEKDGSQWVLEAKNRGIYHFVDRCSPNETRNKDFRDCCNFLISLSNIKLKVMDMY
jgi:hypothetical protein